MVAGDSTAACRQANYSPIRAQECQICVAPKLIAAGLRANQANSVDVDMAPARSITARQSVAAAPWAIIVRALIVLMSCLDLTRVSGARLEEHRKFGSLGSCLLRAQRPNQHLMRSCNDALCTSGGDSSG